MAQTETTGGPKRGAEDVIFDKRALTIGALIIALACAVAAVWRVAIRTESLLKKPAEFEFAVQEHAVEDFRIREPIREIVQERTVDMPEAATDTGWRQEERPDIHITTNPGAVEVAHAAEVIQSSNVTIDTPRIEVGGTEISIDDGPQEITQVQDTVTYAINPIAANVPAGVPADIFRYDNPTPRDKPATHFINAGPRPGRALRIMPRAFGDQDAPSIGKLGPANINLHGTGDFFRVMSRFGDVKARSAVDSSLHWLAAHQESDGLWLAEKFEGDKSGDLAVTGLAVLAFMGGGHTTRKGEYTRNVLRGVEALMRNQREDGAVAAGKGDGGHLMYTHAICTIALCEAYGRARDERVGQTAQKAVAFCEKSVSADGGWRYKPKSQDTDMSVTAWFVQALKTAKLAQLKFDHAVFSQALSYVDSVTDQGASKESNGVVTYQFQPEQRYPSNDHPALTSAGMLIRQFNGMGVKNHLLIKGAELTRAKPPAWNNKDFYYWYYATYAMHNMGGEYRIWWNQRIRDVLLENLSRDGDNRGSWDPKGDHWASAGGRVYTTALGALCLEVYYRYSEALTSFGTAPDLDELFLQQ